MGHDGERRVLVVIHEPHFGGATLSVLRIVPLLEERGWRFAFWVPAPGAVYDELRRTHDIVDGTVRYVHWEPFTLRLPPGPRARLASLPGYFRRYGRFLRRVRPALVHANTLTAVAEAGFARLAGYPTLLHVHEMMPGGPMGSILPRAARVAATEIAGVSAANAAPLAVGRRRPRIVYGSTPVPAERPPRPAEPDPIVVGTVGVVSRRKGSDLFVDAARIVRERTGRRVEFRMIGARDEGDDEWVDGVIEAASALGVARKEGIDVLAELRDWDVFVLPSRADPFPNAVLEAMASGLPVVGTRVDGLAEQITEDTGLLTTPDDPADLARAILTLIESPESRASMGAAARRRVAKDFTHERQADLLEDAYRAAIGGRG
jgi:glycosyltransferase involved in cell wall biosynthesis